ncbi:MAG: putative DNA binding domain-containing protein [Pirellulaceae bacterium]
MNEAELRQKLDELLRLPHETEWLEFKEAKSNFDFRELGRYFSALANEANLKNHPCGWLVFGVVNSDRSICGSNFRNDPASLNSLKHEIARQSDRVTFLEIYTVAHPDGRVVMFQIPPASPGMPVSFQGHWYGRDGESLVALSLQELETIRGQISHQDWSAGECSDASLNDLDPIAIQQARTKFRDKNSAKPFAKEIDAWSDEVFLDRAKICRQGKITRTALLLLGRPESVHHLNPSVAQITWRLEGEERAYEHFGPPFLLTTSELYSRIRNTLQKIDVPGRLVPYEIPKYDKWVILEAIHNAIAHQDYEQQSRIIVTETPDDLTIHSSGRFFEGQLADYTLAQKTPTRYRNRFLADAMVNVNMIDSMGYGIHRMFLEQRKRFYPLPDYDLSQSDAVVVTIPGKVIDPSYTAVLMREHNLPLERVILLDQVQKKRPVEKAEVAKLRREHLVEGRFPNIFVAADVAAATGDKAQYIKNRAFDDEHYKSMIVEYLRKYGHASREDLEQLLMDKLSDVLSEKQKKNKVRNLRTALVNDGQIVNTGSRRYPKWVLAEDLANEPDS